MERNCQEKFSGKFSTRDAQLVLEVQFLIFWLQQVDFSFFAESWAENPMIRKPDVTRRAISPVSKRFFFFIAAGFVI